MGDLSLQRLNRLEPAEFIATLGGVFEHAPWVAEAVVAARPFASVSALHQAMVAVIVGAGLELQMELIRNHPELAGKAAIAGKLTAESTREQKGAGLDQCSPAEFARLTELNQAYGEKFGIPFIIAVKGLTRHDIIAALETRLHHSPESEIAESLNQIYRIGGFRLQALLG